MTNLWYLFTAYTIIWVAIWSYTMWLGRKQTRLFREVERMKALLVKHESNRIDSAMER
jgi:CcmD family protein